jgi:kumamolisin
MDTRYTLQTSRRVAAPGARKIGRGNPNDLVHITIVLKSAVPIDKDSIRAEALKSRTQRRFLTPDEHAKNYGTSDDAISVVLAFAEKYHLHLIGNPDKVRRIVRLVGRRHAMEQAFGTQLDDYSLPNGEQYRGRVGALTLPTSLEPYVVAVLGLDNRREYRPHFRRAVATEAAAIKEFTPQEVAALYGFPTGDGAGQTVAIIELGGAFDQSDLERYFTDDIAQPRKPGATITAAYVDGVAPVPYNDPPAGSKGYTGDDIEVMLDIEVVGAIAPAANIVVYFAANEGDQHFYNAVSEALHAQPRPCVISISWGGPEAGTEQTRHAWDDLAASAASLGTAICIASGDNGAADESPQYPDAFDGRRHVDAPADTPHVLACGGTRVISSNGTARQAEVAWNDGNNGGASGGGVSTVFPVPPWQQAADCIAEGAQPIQGRGVPDVAADASPNSGYLVRADGSKQTIGGTSAVAPLYAGLLARIATKLNGQIPLVLPLFYQASAQAFNDIVEGDNSLYGVPGYSAHPGWDAVSGLGSPRGQAIELVLTR